MTEEERAKRMSKLKDEAHKKSEEAHKDDIDLKVTPVREKDLANIEDYLKDKLNVGAKSITADDVPTPTLSLVQSNSQMRDAEGRPLTPGKFFYKGTGEVFDSVTCAFLVLTKKDLPSFSNKEVLDHTHIWLGAILPEFKPFQMFMRGYGLSGSTGSRFLIGRQRSLKRPFFSLLLTLTSEKTTNDKGTFYNVVINVEPNQDMTQVVTLGELAEKYEPKAEQEADAQVASDLPF